MELSAGPKRIVNVKNCIKPKGRTTKNPFSIPFLYVADSRSAFFFISVSFFFCYSSAITQCGTWTRPWIGNEATRLQSSTPCIWTTASSDVFRANERAYARSPFGRIQFISLVLYNIHIYTQLGRRGYTIWVVIATSNNPLNNFSYLSTFLPCVHPANCFVSVCCILSFGRYAVWVSKYQNQANYIQYAQKWYSIKTRIIILTDKLIWVSNNTKFIKLIY